MARRIFTLESAAVLPASGAPVRWAEGRWSRAQGARFWTAARAPRLGHSVTFGRQTPRSSPGTMRRIEKSKAPRRGFHEPVPRAERSILGCRMSLMRDLADVRDAPLETLRRCSMTDPEGGKRSLAATAKFLLRANEGDIRN